MKFLHTGEIPSNFPIFTFSELDNLQSMPLSGVPMFPTVAATFNAQKNMRQKAAINKLKLLYFFPLWLEAIISSGSFLLKSCCTENVYTIGCIWISAINISDNDAQQSPIKNEI